MVWLPLVFVYSLITSYILITLSCCLLLMQYELDLCVSSGRWVFMLLLMFACNLPGSHIITNADLHKIKPVWACTPEQIAKTRHLPSALRWPVRSIPTFRFYPLASGDFIWRTWTAHRLPVPFPVPSITNCLLVIHFSSVRYMTLASLFSSHLFLQKWNVSLMLLYFILLNTLFQTYGSTSE